MCICIYICIYKYRLKTIIDSVLTKIDGLREDYILLLFYVAAKDIHVHIMQIAKYYIISLRKRNKETFKGKRQITTGGA